MWCVFLRLGSFGEYSYLRVIRMEFSNSDEENFLDDLSEHRRQCNPIT